MPDTDPTPLCAFDVFADGTARKAPDVHTKPAARAAYRWLHFDLASSHLDHWAEANLPIAATRTLLAQKTRPRVACHDDGLLVTLRGINLNAGDEPADMVSLRIWMTADLILTVRRQRNFLMDDVQRQIDENDAPPSSTRMLARVIELNLSRVEDAAFELEDVADKMEEGVYDRGKDAVSDLAPLRRSVIKLRRHLGPLRDALDGLTAVQSPLLPPLMTLRFRDSASRAARAVDELTEVRDRLNALSDHLDMVQTVRLGRNGYLLSVAATIFLPLGFLTGLFGVNLGGMPGQTWEWGFYALCAGMVALGVILMLILRWIRWF
ncbi:zinc transporter [Cognatiyoonia koreensis]|uniref:Zinc transporter n=1 Tax=Cognatiyoonia koreensis TaxID=364200 RepID=A0A1I0PIR9_9RHOB|nr:CorA family divalent cation transporter [Cognatiyoonia koreensis]SEW14316.1 zinc transporter [Cognatiyoonia koreensis]